MRAIEGKLMKAASTPLYSVLFGAGTVMPLVASAVSGPSVTASRRYMPRGGSATPLPRPWKTNSPASLMLGCP